MTLRDIYEFYDKYFGYERNLNPSDSKALYLAIRDTKRMILKIFESGSFTSIEDYSLNRFKNSHVLKYLINMRKMLEADYNDPIKELEFINGFIKVNKGEIGTLRRGIKIPIMYWINHKKSEILLLCFSNAGNLLKELEVFKGLISEFNLNPPLSDDIKNIVCYELNSGKRISLDYKNMKKPQKSTLLLTLNEI